ncbi:hypothetical protein ACVGXB_00340, partial [Enterobacter intestinihominis]
TIWGIGAPYFFMAICLKNNKDSHGFVIFVGFLFLVNIFFGVFCGFLNVFWLYNFFKNTPHHRNKQGGSRVARFFCI